MEFKVVSVVFSRDCPGLFLKGGVEYVGLVVNVVFSTSWPDLF